jgi:hypothetical protein
MDVLKTATRALGLALFVVRAFPLYILAGSPETMKWVRKRPLYSWKGAVMPFAIWDDRLTPNRLPTDGTHRILAALVVLTCRTSKRSTSIFAMSRQKIARWLRRGMERLRRLALSVAAI